MATVQLYKNMVAVTGASVTVSAGTTAKVTLTDPGRRFEKGSDKLTFTVDGGDHSPEWVPPEGRWIQEVRATEDAAGGSITVTIMVV